MGNCYDMECGSFVGLAVIVPHLTARYALAVPTVADVAMAGTRMLARDGVHGRWLHSDANRAAGQRVEIANTLARDVLILVLHNHYRGRRQEFLPAS